MQSNNAAVIYSFWSPVFMRCRYFNSIHVWGTNLGILYIKPNNVRIVDRNRGCQIGDPCIVYTFSIDINSKMFPRQFIRPSPNPNPKDFHYLKKKNSYIIKPMHCSRVSYCAGVHANETRKGILTIQFSNILLWCISFDKLRTTVWLLLVLNVSTEQHCKA